MWCENCQADRAAEANAETQEITCATCGARLTSQQFGNLDRQLKQARELLERWSKEPLLEPYSPLPDKQASHLSELRDSESSERDVDPASESRPATAGKPNGELPSIGEQFEKIFAKTRPPKVRYDLAHGSAPEEESQDTPENPGSKEPLQERDPAEPEQSTNPRKTAPAEKISEEIPWAESATELPISMSDIQPVEGREGAKIHRTDPPPRQTAPATHLNIQQLIEERLDHKKRKLDWMMMVGQWLAYLGVLAMTAGAAVIVFGYFGGEDGMTPRGWMLTTAGQMLLFLGIVTLISNGMERSSEEITDRIDVLGEQLFRFESETRAQFVQGPKLSSENYAEDADSREPEPVEEDAGEKV